MGVPFFDFESHFSIVGGIKSIKKLFTDSLLVEAEKEHQV